MSKHFLYLTNDKIIALVWKGGAIVEREVFTSLDAESPEFDHWLRRHQQTPAWLITDLIEEDFRVDTLPHVRGGDRAAVIERKLQQLYRASPYRHAIVQGREEEGRRDDRVLFHAVTNPELIHPIVNALARAEIPLQGISSSAVLSAGLPDAMDVFFTHTLLVTIVPEFGLRQTYFRDKQIKFSRLTPITYDEGQSVGDLIAAEASRTWQYLDSLRYFAGREESLEVCIVVHERDRDTIAAAIRAYPLFKYRFLDIGDVATRIKLKPAPVSSHAEEVLVHLYAQRGVENHFAAADLLQFAKFRRQRFVLHGATAVILAAGLGVTAYNLQQAARISVETDRFDVQARGAQSEYQNISNLIRGQISATAAMRDTSLFFRANALPSTVAPGDFMRRIARAWTDFPRLRINQIVWAPNQDAAVSPRLQANALPRPLNVRGELKDAAKPAAVAPPPPGAPAASDADPLLPGNQFEIALIEGNITGFRGDYREANRLMEQWLARMNAEPGLKAEVLDWPVEVRSGAVLRGRVEDVDGSEARFAVRLVRDRSAK
ncbi:MAG: hypothetical protein JNK75_10875 [Betaproteobacteria bacterium]|nr:hypothetical protein [Betaproteobacteria bacterium]